MEKDIFYKKINILFITYTHSNGGGAEAVLTTLVNNLPKEKYNITIQEVQTFGVKKELIDQTIVLRKEAILGTFQKADWFRKTKRHFLMHDTRVLKDVFNWNGFDVVVSWNYQLPSFCLLGFKDEYKISWFHGAIYDLDVEKYPEKKQRYAMQDAVFGWADRIVTISAYSLKSALELYPQYKDKYTLVYNGTNKSKILKAAKKKPEKDYDFRHRDVPLLISLGRLDMNKNFSLALQALAVLKEKGVPFEYVVLGQGECLEALREEAVVLNIAEHVHFMGYIQNPYPYIRESDILLLTSKSEGWPTVVIEAMILGKTFVTTPVAGASDELANGGACGLVADWDAEDFAKKLEQLIKDPELRLQMGENGKKNIEQYSMERAVESFENLLASVEKNKSIVNRADVLWNKGKFVVYHTFFGIEIKDQFIRCGQHIKRFLENRNYKILLKVTYRLVQGIIAILESVIFLFPRFVAAVIYCIFREK